MTRLVSAIYRGFGPFGNLHNVSDFDVVETPSELTKNDILLLHGGEDISPSLYNHPVHEFTGADARPSRRDRIEWALVEQAVKLSVPIIGICRGMQLLCAFAGGSLIQDVDNHSGNHKVVDCFGEEFMTNSIHHQMCNLEGTHHELLAWTPTKLSRHHYVGDGRSITNELEREPEAAYFTKINALGVQFHPEFGRDGQRFVDWSVEQANRLFYPEVIEA